ncbi:hypothetical protein V8C86DRAFT_3138034 [Haematococcus lacustris]
MNASFAPVHAPTSSFARQRRSAPTAACSTIAQSVCCSHAVSKRDFILGPFPWAAALILVNQPARAQGERERGLSRYIRKKRNDPLDTYVPLVLAARQQLQSTAEVMESEPAAARELLRNGPFSGLRDSIRAVSEYASQPELAPAFFRSIEDFDQLLAVAVRSSSNVEGEAAQAALAASLRSLDQLLATVPADIMDRSRTVLEVVQTRERELAKELEAERSVAVPA